MFRNERAGLQRLTQQLLPHSQENMEKNIKLLKSDIIPFLGNYISETRNLGKIRDLINLLTFNTSRYENGNLDGVVDAFKRLSDFPAFRRHFASMDRAEIRELFQNILILTARQARGMVGAIPFVTPYGSRGKSRD